MTREEAIRWLTNEKWKNANNKYKKEWNEAFDMAIEALSQPIVAKHFDIQSGYIYCSPQIAENVKVVVRCKDCRHYQKVSWTKEMRCVNPYWATARGTVETDFCSYGERREE